MGTTTSGLTTTTTTGGNVLRITGMASGLDVDGTVTKLMTAEQYKIDTANGEKQNMQWSQDAYKDIITDLKTLQSTFFNSLVPDTNLLSANSYSAFDVTNTNTAVANVTAGVGAQAGSYTVQVNALATGANFTQQFTGAAALTSSSLLTAITGKSGSTETGAGAALQAPLTLAINVNGGTSVTGGSTYNITLDNSSTKNLTISDLVKAINTSGNGVIKASFSELTQKFSITTTATGASQTISLGAATTTGLTNLLGSSIAATNANVSITPPGGSAVAVTTQTTNNFAIDGVKYSLTSLGTSAVTLTQNPQKVLDKINTFIDKFNTLVDKIQTKLTEKKNPAYKPLTDAQKSSMSADQITAWETKAKVGLLRNDDRLQQLLTDLHSAFTAPVSGTTLTVGKYGSASFGFDTSSDYTKSNEVSVVDTAKFTTAVSSNSDQLMKLFTNVSTSKDDTTKNSESGIFTRIQNVLLNNVGLIGSTFNTATLTKYANSQDAYSNYGDTGLNTLPDQMYAKTAQIKKLQIEFSTMQTAYYNKFSALETAMSKLNNQSATLTSMLSGG